MKDRKAFTLIELLVVIAIIALLLAIMLPGLGRAKDIAKRMVCMSNQRQLAVAWMCYIQNNDEFMPSPCPGWSTKDRKEAWIYWGDGWKEPPWPQDQWEESITRGTLFPYTQDFGVYRCPAGEKDEMITYAGFGALGWREPIKTENNSAYGPVVHKLPNLRQPGTRSVYIDEGKLSPHFYSVYYDRDQFYDQPANRHNEGVTMSFADGHADYWRWEEKVTREACRLDRGAFRESKYRKNLYPGNVDIYKLRMAAWGEIYNK